MPSHGFELANQAIKLLQTYAFNRTTTATSDIFTIHMTILKYNLIVAFHRIYDNRERKKFNLKHYSRNFPILFAYRVDIILKTAHCFG